MADGGSGKGPQKDKGWFAFVYIVDRFFKLANLAIRFGWIFFGIWVAGKTAENIAGTNTVFVAIVQAMFTNDRYVTILTSALVLAIVIITIQEYIRRRTVTYFKGYKAIEEKIDSSRSTSGLNNDGSPNEEDLH
jgi:hypothetical protein